MIRKKSISVIITTYIRYHFLDDIIKSWLKQPIDELWILDGGGKFKSKVDDKRLQVFNMPTDLGPKMDYAFALLTEGDIVILADDDVVVKEGFTDDLLRCQEQKGGIVGIIGREFHGPNYYRNTKWWGSSRIDEPKKVGFVGVIIMSPREHFGFDVRGLPRNCDDIWWLMKAKPNIDKWVAPTKAYRNTDQCNDVTAMCKNSGLRAERQNFYRKYYMKHRERYIDKQRSTKAKLETVKRVRANARAIKNARALRMKPPRGTA